MGTYPGSERRSVPRAPWKDSAWGVVLVRLWALIAYSDTTPTRFMLALSASAWAIMLAWPGNTFERPAYRYMADLGGQYAEAKWCLLWALHATGMWWRLFTATPRPMWSLIIHSLGLLLFSTSAIAIFLTLTYPIPAAIASDIAMALAAAWVLVRTHINSEPGWRND